MAKKGSGKTYTSKGERPNISKWAKKACRREYMQDACKRTLNQQKALRKGKRVVYTIANPNTNETNKRFIRVVADPKTLSRSAS